MLIFSLDSSNRKWSRTHLLTIPSNQTDESTNFRSEPIKTLFWLKIFHFQLRRRSSTSWMCLGDHPKTFLQKTLCCQTPPWCLKVGGWVVVKRAGGYVVMCRRLCGGGPGHYTVSTGTVSILDSRFPVPCPSPSRLTITTVIYKSKYKKMVYSSYV